VCTQHVTREPIKRFISSDEGARLAENLSVIIAGDIKKIVKSVKTWGLQCDEVVGDERDYINISTCGYNMSSWQVDLPPI
jgi:hypothetical protein